MSRPADALRKMAGLVDVMGNLAYLSYMQSWLGTERIMPEENVAQWVANQRRALSLSEVFHVADHMTEVVVGASATLDGTDAFTHEMLPAELGFAWLDRPLVVTEARGRKQPCVAISWYVGAANYADVGSSRPFARLVPGVWVVYWGSISHPEDEVFAGESDRDKMASAMLMGDHQPLDVVHYSWGQRVGPVEYPPTPRNQIVGEPRPLADFVPNHHRSLMALWRLFGQTLVSRRREEADRPTVKAMRRMKLPTGVTVITLRRISTGPATEGEGQVEWGYRWWVRGHWAWRRCSQHHPQAEPDGEGGWHNRVYIAPFAKNAHRTDLPWSTNQRVSSLTR